MADRTYVAASVSLALVKYWGKADVGRNTPATTSIGVTLSGLETRTAVSASPTGDSVVVDGKRQPIGRYHAFFEHVRRETGVSSGFDVESNNTFPTSAGLASSSSGFAALALGCARAVGADLPRDRLSALALLGSASAGRAVYDGFAKLPERADAAVRLFPKEHWPQLRVLAVSVSSAGKPISSRDGMHRSRETSPYYDEWVRDSRGLARAAEEAISSRDIARLGPVMRLSYLRMVATMISADPPFLYWHPQSVAVIRLCEELRADGIPAWETMDAGPQVKIVTVADYLNGIENAVAARVPEAMRFPTRVGDGAREITEAEFNTSVARGGDAR